VEIPIIFVTGHGDIPMTVRAMKEGAAELTKPFRANDLLAAVVPAIERERVRQSARASSRRAVRAQESHAPRAGGDGARGRRSAQQQIAGGSAPASARSSSTAPT
jgi:DNA-binding NtrC family response regulator